MANDSIDDADDAACNHDYEMVYTQRPDEHPAPVGWVCHVCDHFKPLDD